MRLPEIMIILRRDQLDEFNELAKKTGISRSGLIRNALDYYLTALRHGAGIWRPGLVGVHDTWQSGATGRACIACGQGLGFEHAPSCTRPRG